MSREFPKNNPEQNIALPTVGRIVLWKHPLNQKEYPAIVVAVVAGSHQIECLHAFVPEGIKTETSVPHLSEAATGAPYWDWMDFQKGQAAKTTELERAIDQMKDGHKSTGLRSSPHELNEISKTQSSTPPSEGGKR